MVSQKKYQLQKSLIFWTSLGNPLKIVICTIVFKMLIIYVCTTPKPKCCSPHTSNYIPLYLEFK